MRKLELKIREKVMTIPRKEKRFEARREEKAAVLDKSIEKELLERLKTGVYGDIYSYPVKEYNRVLHMEVLQTAGEDEEEEEEPEVEYVEGYDELEEDFGGSATTDLSRVLMTVAILGSFSVRGVVYTNFADDPDEIEREDDDMDTVGDQSRTSKQKRGSGFGKHGGDDLNKILTKKAKIVVEVEQEDTYKRQQSFQ